MVTRQESRWARSLIEASLDPLVTISPKGKITDMNQATVNITGIEREKLIGSDFFDYFTEPPKAREVYQEVFAKGSVVDSPLTLRHKDGKLTDVLFNGSVYKDDKGNVLGVVIVARDVTAQKKMAERDIELQKEIKEKTVSLEEAQRIAHLGSWEWDIAANSVKWSDEMYRMCGFTPGEFEATYEGFLEGVHPDDKDYVNQLVQEAYQQKKSLDYFCRIIRKNDGMVLVMHGRGTVLLDEKGNVVKMVGTAQDVTEAKAASQYSLSLIEASLDPLVTISPEGKITDVNEASVKVTGVPREKLIGTDFFDYFTEPQKAREVYQEVFAKGSVADSPLTLRHKDGKLTDVLFNGSVYKDDRGNVLGIVIVARDITDQKIFENELIEAKRNAERATQRAEESTKLKEAFLANMSHEIRTPLNSIIGFTDLLLKKNLGEQENDFVRTIKMSGENLLEIINNVLDVSKIESGSMTFEQTPLSVKDLFISLNLMLLQKAKKKNLNLLFVCENNVPDVLLGDPARLSQILINLVGNAIKFTQKGNVDVFAKALNEENEIVQIEFSVTDTGIGIPEDKQQHIFERFRQAESHTSRNYGGTGLGLTIARQLVELQGGMLTVKSKEGKGSVFSFILPFKKSKETQMITGEVHVDINTQELSKLNVLIVEDNPVNIKFVMILFSEYGIKTDIAKNGKLAVEKIKNNQYDLVLMDIEMPEMNGYEATVAIRNDLKNNIPIIAMTAHAMAGEKEKCIKLGMNDYVSKPINPNLLFEKMLFFTSGSAKTLNMESKEKVIDLSYLFNSVSGKKHLILELFDIFLQQTPLDLAIINKAVIKADYLTIKQFSHKMKSTVSVMGISILDPLLQQMVVLGEAANEIEKIKALNDQLNEICNKAFKEMEIEKKSILIK
jgi:PAS domain S-box-containing protein